MNKDIFNEKEVLDLLNYVDIDDDENSYECLKMDQLKKRKLKKNLLKQVRGKNKRRKYKYGVAAAAVASVILIGVASPAFAKNIPILNSIIQAINGGGTDSGEYQKYSEVIDKSVTDNGITFTINEVVCDDSNLMIGYTIKSKDNIRNLVEKDKNVIFGLIQSLKINGKKADSGSGQDGKYLDENTYVNSETVNIGNLNFGDLLKIDLNLKNIYDVKGNWNFKFGVSKEEMLKNTKIYKPNTEAKLPYADIKVEKINFSPINTSIMVKGKYNSDYKNSEKIRKERQEYSWFVFDDKGNEIISKGASSGKAQDSSSNDFYEEYRFMTMKNTPKYLTVIPYMMDFVNAPEYVPPVSKKINGVYPIELSQGKIGKIIIKEIKTYKDKTVIRYKVEGKAPFLQAKGLYIVDDKNNTVETIGNWDTFKKDKNNDYIKEFMPLNKNKKYKIQTNNLDIYELRNDLKFRIDLSK